ncbi:MAG TPA: iron-containing alcohol dehydrogenase [Solirubrobacteraceae bacterium]|nr:iron-containing alcohol dehydrogenase [Solirubrobacteraceae bacterium]
MHFGRGALDDAAAALGTGFTLLTTERAQAMAPQLAAVAAVAAATHAVAPGRVDEIAGALVDAVDPGELIVALGGGRVIDVAKAIAAAREPGSRPRVAAIPTTLSAAEMTATHRRAAGADGSLPGVRPAIVVNDPALSASQPDAALAASAANALGHAAEGPATTRASPVPALAGREAARRIAAAYATGDGAPDRDELALGALLSGYAIDGCGYGLHHVLSQTLARFGGVAHGAANAAMLPHTLRALERRGAPGAGDLVGLATDLAGRAQTVRLRDLGVDAAVLDACADAASGRAELDLIPPRPDREELRELYESAF